LPKAYNFEGDGNFTKYNMEVAFLAGKQATQPEQEPVAWITKTGSVWKTKWDDSDIPLYTTPPQPKEPEQEPVWIQPNHLQKARQAPFLCRVEPKHRDDFVPMYTTPPHRKPLSMQERTSIVRANKSFHDKNDIDAYGIIDDVEAAHGIKEDA